MQGKTPITKNEAPDIELQMMRASMTKNISVIDEQGNIYGATYPNGQKVL